MTVGTSPYLDRRTLEDSPLQTGTLIAGQKQLVFFDPDAPPPNTQAILDALNPDNPLSPYFGMVGNRKGIGRLVRIDFNSLTKYNHDASELNVAVLGGSGSGKTEVVRRHLKANRLPTIEIHPKAARRLHDIFLAIKEKCQECGVPLVQMGKPNYYVSPPVNVFFDEVHALAPNIVQGLLKATEKKDRILVTEEGVTLDCRYVHWVIATTDRGRLFDAFDTRFTRIQLGFYKKEEIARIVHFNYPEIPMDACTLAAHYAGKVPREAIAFASEMKLEYAMYPGDWSAVAHKVAQENDIDEHGMTGQRVKVIAALGQGPVAANRLPFSVGVKVEELEKFILPWLMEPTEEAPPLVSVTSRGYTITEAGLEELDKRQIQHKGKDALAA